MDYMLSLLSPAQIQAIETAYGTVESWFISLGDLATEAYEIVIVDLIM